MTLLQVDTESVTSNLRTSSFTTSVFDKGSYSLKIINVDASSSSSSTSTSPPKPVLIITPTTKGTYPVVLFLPGFMLRNTFYQDLLKHISSHGFVLVAPQLYEFPISGPQEIDYAAQVTNWLVKALKPLLPDSVEPDFTKLTLSGHSRGGKAAFALALGYAKTALKFSVLIGIDPVAGGSKCTRTMPHILTYVPRSFDLSIPVAVVGTGLGPDQRSCLTPPCAPEGLNHEEFFNESKPPCAHFVAKDYGHMDMLDDNPPGIAGRLSGCTCKNGSGPRDTMRRATGGIVVAFIRAYLNGDSSDLEAIVGDPSLSPAKLQPVEFVPS